MRTFKKPLPKEETFPVQIIKSKEELHDYLGNLNGEEYNKIMVQRIKLLNLYQISYSRWESTEYDTLYKFSIADCNNGMYIKKIICKEANGLEYQLLNSTSPNMVYKAKIGAILNPQKCCKPVNQFKWDYYDGLIEDFETLFSPLAKQQNSISAALREFNRFVEKNPKVSTWLVYFYGVKKVSLDMLPRPYFKGAVDKEDNPFCRWVRLTRESEKVMKGEPFVCNNGKIYVMVPMKYSIKGISMALFSNNEIKEMKMKR